MKRACDTCSLHAVFYGGEHVMNIDINKIWLDEKIATYKQNTRCLSVNTILAGKYLVGPVLGQGGFGITYKGFDLNMETYVAIKEYFPVELVSRDTTTMYGDKVLSLGGEKSQTYQYGLKKYIAEAQSVSQFADTPGVVSIKDFFFENETAYIVMEYIEGQNLKEYLKEHGGKVAEEEALNIMKPVAKALSQIHAAGIIHRDISPENIMLTFVAKEPKTEIKSVKLIDFGAARMSSTNDQKSLTIILKHGYAPEEQYRTHGDQGTWTDVYAFCAVLYKMMTGATPVQAMDRLFQDELQPVSRRGVKVSKNTEAAIMKGLAVKKENRIETMQELISILYEGNKVKVSGQKNKAKTAIAAGLCVAAIIAGVLIYGKVSGKRERNEADPETIVQVQVREQEESDTEDSSTDGETMVGDQEADTQKAQIVYRKPETMLAVGQWHILSLRDDGTVLASGNNDYGQCEVSDWTDIVAVYAGELASAGLTADGSVYFAGTESLKEGVSSWRDITQLAVSSSYVLGLKQDGTVISAGNNRNGCCEVGDWKNIESIWICAGVSFGICTDGTLKVAGELIGQEELLDEVSQWTDLKQIVVRQQAESTFYGLKKDGTVLCAGQCEDKDREDVGQWKDVTWLSTGDCIVAGLCSDGRVCLSTGKDEEPEQWTGMVAIGSTYDEVVGLKKDGTIEITKVEYSGNSSLEEILQLDNAIQVVWSGENLSVLLEDGTVKSVGIAQYNDNIDLEGWPFVTMIAAEDSNLVGISSDRKIYRSTKGRGISVSGFEEEMTWEEERDWAQKRKDMTPILYNSWSDVVDVSCSGNHIVALLNNGTVKAAGFPENQGDLENNVDYKTGLTKNGACDVGAWKDICQVIAQHSWTVGLKEDGTLLCAGNNAPDYSEYTKIQSIWGNDHLLAAIAEDGTVMDVSLSIENGQNNVKGWTNMKKLAVSDNHLVGLTTGGTVMATGTNAFGQCDVEEWADVVDIAAGNTATTAITSDGKVLMAGTLPNDILVAKEWPAVSLDGVLEE